METRKEKRGGNILNYNEYILSEEWRNTRLWALDRADNKCQICCNKHSLQVHHNEYTRLGREIPSDLIVLCKKCHQLFHDSLPSKNNQDVTDVINDMTTSQQLDKVLSKLKGRGRYGVADYNLLSKQYNNSSSPEKILAMDKSYLKDLRIKALQLNTQMLIEQNGEWQKAASGDELIRLMRVAQGLTKQKIAYSRMNDEDLLVEFVKEFPDINNYLSNLF